MMNDALYKCVRIEWDSILGIRFPRLEPYVYVILAGTISLGSSTIFLLVFAKRALAWRLSKIRKRAKKAVGNLRASCNVISSLRRFSSEYGVACTRGTIFFALRAQVGIRMSKISRVRTSTREAASATTMVSKFKPPGMSEAQSKIETDSKIGWVMQQKISHR